MRNPFLPSFLPSFFFLRALCWLSRWSGEARDVAGGDAGRDEVRGDLLGGAARPVPRVAAAMARLPSDGVSGRPTNGGIARLRGGR
jgi:hypothetical protein